MFSLDPDLANKALSLTGSQYQVPGNYGTNLGGMSQQLSNAAPAESPPPPSNEPPDMVKQATEMTKVAGPIAGTPSGDAAETPEERGKKNQQQAMSKISSILGAIGNFYTGNFVGAANSVQGLTGTSEQQAERQAKSGGSSQLGMLGGLFGGGK